MGVDPIFDDVAASFSTPEEPAKTPDISLGDQLAVDDVDLRFEDADKVPNAPHTVTPENDTNSTVRPGGIPVECTPENYMKFQQAVVDYVVRQEYSRLYVNFY